VGVGGGGETAVGEASKRGMGGVVSVWGGGVFFTPFSLYCLVLSLS